MGCTFHHLSESGHFYHKMYLLYYLSEVLGYHISTPLADRCTQLVLIFRWFYFFPDFQCLLLSAFRFLLIISTNI